ncbi:MAG: glycoside hydrolase family 25 protein [Parafilimonas terrae]|nr:glycoside hydrolase family 25 protein [Parafilimonas terrae]
MRNIRVLGFALTALAAAALAGCAATPPVPMLSQSFGGPLPTDFAVHGIDVSKYQGKIDWSRVAGSGVQFAWIKSTEGGDRVDSRFGENWAGAQAAGVPRGAYHFMYWCRPWQEQAAWMEQNVPNDPDALPPVLDVELTPTSPTCKRTLYRAPTLAEMRGMLAEMERFYGKKPIIYSTVDFYAGILSGGALTEYPIWVRSTKYHPSVRYAGRDWHFWQYQSDGFIDGIKGKVDRNAFFGSPDQWAKFLSTAALPLPVPN